jgi:hypothetical protein
MSFSWSSGCCLVLAVAGVACGGEGDVLEPVASTTDALRFAPAFDINGEPGGGYSYMYSRDGAAGVSLTDGATTICFLSGIFGIFKSAADRVAIEHSQGSWGLRGAKGTGNPGGYAHCILAQPPGTAQHPFVYYSWKHGDPSVNMGTTTNRTCFLMAVQGNFSGTDDRVETRRSGGNWYLDGTSASAANGIAASAMCVPRAPISDDSYSWTTPNMGTRLPFFNGSQWLNGTSDTGAACFLTHVRGRFNTQGGAAMPVARAWMEFDGASYAWWLSGSTDDPGTRIVKSRCVF